MKGLIYYQKRWGLYATKKLGGAYIPLNTVIDELTGISKACLFNIKNTSYYLTPKNKPNVLETKTLFSYVFYTLWYYGHPSK